MEDRESLMEPARQIAALIKGARFAIIDGYGETFYAPEGQLSQGMQLIETFVHGLASANAQAAQTTGTDRAALSSREIDVLRLLAAGKSNAQIADELVISVNTVIRHVSNIFAKTGAANRAQAAVYARDHAID
jgi:DNA-binding NarL/FixJ family response regulator